MSEKRKINGFRVGSSDIENGLVLAPMAGVTDAAFRALCRAHGAEYTVSEMVSAKALCYDLLSRKNAPSKTAPLAAVRQSELPMAVQLFGSEPEFMARAARLIESGDYRASTSECAPTAIDINMGCPVQKVVGNREGSALMRDPVLAGRIVEAMASAVSLPITVKIRIGWDENEKNAPELAKRLEASGASLICVHGRTRKQLYSPGVDLDMIRKVKEAVNIPVVGNGDIYSATDALRMISETGCDGIAVGRGAMGNPWIFEEIRAALRDVPYTPPSDDERLDTALCQAERAALEKGEETAVREMRGHISWYLKGMRGAANARFKINTASTLSDLREIINALKTGGETDTEF